MKKNAIVCIILVIVMIMSVMTVSAFGATDPSAGTFKEGGSVISKADDGYYYVNDTFTYEANKDATGYFYVKINSKDDLKDLDASKLYNGSGVNKDTVPTVDPKSSVTEYYAFADYYTKDGETTFSKVVVLVVDTVAPTLNSQKIIDEWVNSSNRDGGFPNSWISATDELKFLTGWLEDATLVVETTAQKTENENTVNNEKMLNVVIEYCSPDDYYDDKEWDSGETVNANVEGKWYFRFLVTDMAGNEVRSDIFSKDVRDNTAPEIELSTSQLKVQTEGIKAGSTYTIPTPTYKDVSGVTTKYYIVYKLVKGEYVEIYNSDTKTVAKGYDKYISTEGVLSPASNELPKVVDGNPEYLYKVVYHATDKKGMSSELDLNILITKPDTVKQPTDIWKIVLVVVSALCAVGIIVLIFVKPSNKPDTKAK